MVRTSFKPTRERKHRRLAKQSQQHHDDGNGNLSRSSIAADGIITTSTPDTNADILLPTPKDHRREQLKAELTKDIPKMSSKKAKRLNKYIENKLKKEETNELIKKLAENRVDTSLFRSARELGRGLETKKEKIERAIKEEKAGILSSEGVGLLYEERIVRDMKEWDEKDVGIGEMDGVDGDVKSRKGKNRGKSKIAREEDEGNEEDQGSIPKSVNGDDLKDEHKREREKDATETPPLPPDSAAQERAMIKSIIGGGLKRPLEVDETGKPILKKFKRAPNVEQRAVPPPTPKWAPPPQPIDSDEEMGSDCEEESEDGEEDEEEDEEWHGFSGEEYDLGGASEESGSISDGEGEGGSEDEEDDEEDDGGGGGDGEDDNGEEGGSGDSDSNPEETAPVPRLKKGTSEKASIFKAWALAQRLKLLNGGEECSTESSTITLPAIPVGYVHRPRIADSPPPPELTTNTINPDRKAFYVAIERPVEIQAARLALPVVAEEQRIMEAIHANPCVVICGETGSGKTTQVPQFLYESGYGHPDSPTPGMIGVTQPRRVAAVSMAKRVGDELGDSEKVSYQIRFEGTVGPKTAIKFMTDGVLLRELSMDFLLSKYSAIIIDEAHERGINTDILIGVMSRVIKLREEMHKENPEIKPLTLVIMSATLRVSDFTENKTLFATPPPLLSAEARQYPVTIHFSRRTPRDYLDEAYRKICKIHRRLPAGGILVFLTGQNEIQYLLRKLRKTFPVDPKEPKAKEEEELEPAVKIPASEAVVEAEDVELTNTSTDDAMHIQVPDEDTLDFPDLDGDDSEGDMNGFGPEEDGGAEAPAGSDAPLHVLPLYSLLPTNKQLQIFEPPPEGHRLCVLATNIAETSLTIPGIRYVVDTGRVKQRNYDKLTGVQSYDIGWVSKASAAQRAGRSGRTGPGHCYRLYSSAVYERDFEEFGEAEVRRMPIEGVVLQMKAMGIDVIENFPFPTPPERDALRKAEQVLGYLGALEMKPGVGGGSGPLTELGKSMALFPLPPRFAKILIIGQQHGCLPYVIAIVAALSVGEIFISEHQLGIDDEESNSHSESEQTTHSTTTPDNQTALLLTRKSAKLKTYRTALKQFSTIDPTSDILRLLSVVCAFEWESVSLAAEESFCDRSFVRHKAMIEIRRLRQQITNIVKSWSSTALPAGGGTTIRLPPPTPLQIKALKQIVAAGFIDNIAIRSDLLSNPPPLPPSSYKGKPKKIQQIHYVPLFPPTNLLLPTSGIPGAVNRLTNNPGTVTIHPSSTLCQLPVSQAPQYIIYSSLTLSQSSSSTEGGDVRIRMSPLTPIPEKHIAKLAKGTRLLAWSKPLAHIPPKMLDEEGQRKECWVVPRLGGWGRPEGGWELPPEKVVMGKVGTGWVVE